MLLGLLVITGLVIARMHSLFAVAMLTSIYSLLSAAVFVVLDAVDVALTEAAVGAGFSTIVMLAAVSLTGEREQAPEHRPVLPLLEATEIPEDLPPERVTPRKLLLEEATLAAPRCITALYTLLP